MEETPYIRVGINYYKKINPPKISGEETKRLAKWNQKTIIQDHGKKLLDEIPAFDGFCCIPSHLDYKRKIGRFYNTYNEIPFHPVEQRVSAKEIPTTMEFLKHIFGNQLELGLDYIKLLYEKPTQKLPILCLVSKKRSTGKSTFVSFLKAIFDLNATFIKGDAFESQFNSDWVDQLLVAIDEVLFKKQANTERLKYLSTAIYDKLEKKGLDRIEIEIFLKLILCSNNEDNFIIIDENEERFWVRKIPPVKRENPDLLKDLTKEIPAFLRYLIDRPFYTKKETRMWFKPEDLRTSALDRLVARNNKLEAKMIELFYEYFQAIDSAKEITVVPSDVIQMVKRMFGFSNCKRNDVRTILKKNWGLTPQSNSLTYEKTNLNIDEAFVSISATGRYYTIDKFFISEKFDELMN